MSREAIIKAITTAKEKGEDLQLWQAIEWMYAYDLMTYKQYMFYLREVTK